MPFFLLSRPASSVQKIVSSETSPVAFPEKAERAAVVRTHFDVVVVLTVWRRPTLELQLSMIRSQTALKLLRTNVIIFQNGHHLDVSTIVHQSMSPGWWNSDVQVTFIRSSVPTGYFGRFLAPLVSFVDDLNGFFIICDDDVILGSRYVENMLRVVKNGFFAVRNGRFVHRSGNVYSEDCGAAPNGWSNDIQVTFESDVEYDFGGHVWAGRYAWLREVWKFPPPTLDTGEDFWISAVLKTKLGISTRRPRCLSTDMQTCACSMQSAIKHEAAEIGSTKGGDLQRTQSFSLIAQSLHYEPVSRSPEYPQIYTFHKPGHGPFHVANSVFENCLFWI